MTEDAVTREEHLAWCKRRALEYLDRYDINNAVASMVSDMGKHPETVNPSPFILAMGLSAARSHDISAARRWITGFN